MSRTDTTLSQNLTIGLPVSLWKEIYEAVRKAWDDTRFSEIVSGAHAKVAKAASYTGGGDPNMDVHSTVGGFNELASLILKHGSTKAQEGARVMIVSVSNIRFARKDADDAAGAA